MPSPGGITGEMEGVRGKVEGGNGNGGIYPLGSLALDGVAAMLDVDQLG